MSTTEVALTAHLVRPGATLDDGLLAQACRELSSRFGIEHATLQIEAGDPAHPCTLAPSEVTKLGHLHDAAHGHVEHAVDQRSRLVQGNSGLLISAATRPCRLIHTSSAAVSTG